MEDDPELLFLNLLFFFKEAALTAPQPVWLLDIDLFNFLRFGTSNIPIVERSKNNKEIFRLNQN